MAQITAIVKANLSGIPRLALQSAIRATTSPISSLVQTAATPKSAKGIGRRRSAKSRAQINRGAARVTG